MHENMQQGRASYSGFNPCEPNLKIPSSQRTQRKPGEAKKARKKELKKRIEEYSEEFEAAGHSEASAMELGTNRATKEMKTLAALHNPDMIAGGFDKITGCGDSGVNSAIGSSWGGKKNHHLV